jgi:hypothetical protein
VMEDCWPFGVALWGEASNHLVLRWLMTVVVSDEEKAHVMRQVGTGKASGSEPLLKRRNNWMTSKPGSSRVCGKSLAGARLLARRCPACKRREPGLRLLHGTWEGECRHCLCRALRGAGSGERERVVRLNPETLSTVAAPAGGPARSSGEAPVMGVERRGRLIDGFVRTSNRDRAVLGGDEWAGQVRLTSRL